jgi:8-oxo-dGTP pyrophosphatase MutT (NUDIX family)/phosphohistidine phosphatase SixA
VSEDVLAAGGVLWRGDPAGEVEVALVHRPRYDDWTFPKGKLDGGEQLAVCAHREVAEETGYVPTLGRQLGEHTYDVTGKSGQRQRKLVRYWTMSDGRGGFTPNREVDELRWLPVAAAEQLLTYPRDVDLLHAMTDRPLPTVSVLVVRHGRAGDKASWAGEDRLRPLDGTGRQQAQWVGEVASCWGPTRVMSADPVRCVQTVTPLAERLRVPVELGPALSETAFERDPKPAVALVRELGAAGCRAAVCSQGGVIPGLIGQLARDDGLVLDEVEARKGSLWVLSFSSGRLVAADYLPDLAPPA